MAENRNDTNKPYGKPLPDADIRKVAGGGKPTYSTDVAKEEPKGGAQKLGQDFITDDELKAVAGGKVQEVKAYDPDGDSIGLDSPKGQGK